MELFCTVLIIIINYFVIKMSKKTLNLLSLFSVIWFLMILFAKLRLFGLKQASDEAFLVVDIGGVCFALAYLVAVSLNARFRFKPKDRPSGIKLEEVHERNEDNKPSINLVLFVVLFAIVALFQTIFLMRALGVLRSGGFQLIHRAVRDTAGTGIVRTNLEKQVNFLLIQPFVFASIPISLLALFRKVKYYRIIFFLSLYLSITYFLTHAGRILIIDYIVYILFIIQVYKLNISRKVKRRVALIILLGLFGVVLITASRRGFNFSVEYLKTSFVKEIYDYFAIPIPMLSYWMDYAKSTELHTYGLAFTNGFLTLPIQFLDKIGVDISWYANLVGQINLTETMYVGAAYNDMNYNAFVTVFYFFFVDFRYVGVVLGSAAFGAISGRIDRAVTKERLHVFANFALYLMFSQSIARIFARWQFYRTNYILAFLFIFLLCHHFKFDFFGKRKRT